ncbi:MAG: hypothetical protein H9W81_18440 [Enterococcus sp.]|nr:hypothetical protein [Enterococcus sp.]
MTLIQGNKASFDTASVFGFVPEIGDDDMFSLYAVIIRGTESERVLIHYQQIRVLAVSAEFLEGHAREMLIRSMESREKVEVSKLVEALQYVAIFLSVETPEPLRETILTASEGTLIQIIPLDGYQNISYYYRFEAYQIWSKLKDKFSRTAYELSLNGARIDAAHLQKARVHLWDDDDSFDEELEWTSI